MATLETNPAYHSKQLRVLVSEFPGGPFTSLKDVVNFTLYRGPSAFILCVSSWGRRTMDPTEYSDPCPIPRNSQKFVNLAGPQKFPEPQELGYVGHNRVIWSYFSFLFLKNIMNTLQCKRSRTFFAVLKPGNQNHFPSGPMAKTPGSQCRRAGFNPWSGN